MSVRSKKPAVKIECSKTARRNVLTCGGGGQPGLYSIFELSYSRVESPAGQLDKGRSDMGPELEVHHGADHPEVWTYFWPELLKSLAVTRPSVQLQQQRALQRCQRIRLHKRITLKKCKERAHISRLCNYTSHDQFNARTVWPRQISNAVQTHFLTLCRLLKSKKSPPPEGLKTRLVHHFDAASSDFGHLSLKRGCGFS